MTLFSHVAGAIESIFRQLSIVMRRAEQIHRHSPCLTRERNNGLGASCVQNPIREVQSLMLTTIIALLAGGYLLVVLVMYLAQTRPIFPTYLASFAGTELPGFAQRLRIPAADGTQLAGVVLPPTCEGPGEEVLLLGFGGKVWNVENMALSLHRYFPSMQLAGFH